MLDADNEEDEDEGGRFRLGTGMDIPDVDPYSADEGEPFETSGKPEVSAAAPELLRSSNPEALA